MYLLYKVCSIKNILASLKRDFPFASSGRNDFAGRDCSLRSQRKHLIAFSQDVIYAIKNSIVIAIT